MLLQLKQLYGEHCIIDSIPEYPNDYFWYKDEQNHLIGIKKIITSAERKLLGIVFNEISAVNFDQHTRLYWSEILLNGKTELLKKVVKQQKQVRFIFFTHQFDSETKQEFDALMKELNDESLVVFLGRQYGVILDFTMSDEYSFEEMAQAMQQDFYQNINFYLTPNYELNDQISHVFNREYTMYQKYRNPSVLLINQNEMILQFLIYQMNHFDGFETVWESLKSLDHDLLEVAMMYIKHNLNSSMAAKALYMHRNTFMNKLERFISLTSLNIKEFDHALIAYVMIKGIDQRKG